MSIPYVDKLDKNQREVFKNLVAFSPEFILSGGTALMLQLGHRRSFDFDCFSQKPLKRNLLQKITEVFGKEVQVQLDESDVLMILTPLGIKVDFVFYPYPPKHQLVKTESVYLSNLSDIATDKAWAVGRRGVWRDYVDLFFILKRQIFSLKYIIREAKERFGGKFNEKLFLGQLDYFGDLEIAPIEFLQESYSSKQIMEFLRQMVDKYTRDTLSGL